MPATIETCQSGIWQTNSTEISGDGSFVVVDPAYFPGEIDASPQRSTSTRSGTSCVPTSPHGPRADLVSIEALLDAVATSDVDAALAIALPRAADVPDMPGHHRSNCRSAVLTVPE